MENPPLPPGPGALPWVGNLPAFLRDPLSFLGSLAREHGDVVSFRLGREPLVLINEPALIDRVVRDRSFERSERTRGLLASFLGQGLLSLEGSPHLRHRRLMAPAFHRERIRRYVEIMASETYRTLSGWQSGRERDLRDDMMRLTFTIVARALFNTGSDREAKRVDHALKKIMPWVVPASMLSRALMPGSTVFWGPAQRRAIDDLGNVVRTIVRERRASAGVDHGDLLTMLIAARDEDGSALSDEDICAETLTMLLAGHDTTAHTMTWIWYLLGQNPDVLAQLTREVHGVLGEREVGFDDLPRLELTERVVRETLRLYPPSWWADRASAQESELGGYRIPARTPVVWSTWVTQRDPRNFDEPERFLPDRWLPERASKVADGAYIPFGAGVHVCIGNAFALTEARVILAATVQRFAMRTTPRYPVRARPMITLGMASPFAVVPTHHQPSRRAS